MIRIENLWASIGGFQLKDVSLRVPAGASFVLLGPSGAGKTLLLETALGLHRPRHGCVCVDGVDVTRLPPEQRRVAYVPQDLALFPHLSVQDNILFGLHAQQTQAEQDAELLRWAELLDITALLDRPNIATLSGGERQRVALARALIVRPKVLFLDEPFCALDAHIRTRLQEHFRELQRSLGLTLFHVTHDQEEAFLMADQMALMSDGRLLQVGTPSELYARPANLSAARFFLMRNIYPGHVVRARRDGLYDVAMGDLRVTIGAPPGIKPGLPIHVGIRAEDIVLLRPDRPVPKELRINMFDGTVRQFVNFGHRRLLRMQLGDATGPMIDVTLTHHAWRDMAPSPGDVLRIHMAPSAFCVFPAELDRVPTTDALATEPCLSSPSACAKTFAGASTATARGHEPSWPMTHNHQG